MRVSGSGINARTYNSESFRPQLRHKTAQTRRRRNILRMRTNKIILRQTDIENIQPQAKRLQLWDLKAPGLLLEVMPSGSKIFRFRKTINYKDQKTTIGTYPAVSLDEARAKAIELAALSQRVDFTAVREEKKQELTLKELVSEYFTQYADSEVRTASELKKAMPRWFAKCWEHKLSTIDSTTLQTALNELSPHLKNKARNLVRSYSTGERSENSVLQRRFRASLARQYNTERDSSRQTNFKPL